MVRGMFSLSIRWFWGFWLVSFRHPLGKERVHTSPLVSDVCFFVSAFDKAHPPRSPHVRGLVVFVQPDFSRVWFLSRLLTLLVLLLCTSPTFLGWTVG